MTGNDLIGEVVAATAGMMHTKTYRALYELARDDSQANILDIGVGQGTTTISYALGILASDRPRRRVAVVDQFFQHSAPRPHRYTKESNPDDCVERNVEVFRSHLARYDVSDMVDVFVGTTTEVARDFPPDARFDVLSIDVDGHIDRDLGYFYDHVEPGGFIVIDDCVGTVNRRGLDVVERMCGRTESEVLDWANHLPWRRRRRLLGKHLLTYELASRMEDAGALERHRALHGSTVVFRKWSDRPFASFDLGDLAEIEDQIVDELVRLSRNRLRPLGTRLSHAVERVRNRLGW